MSDDLETIVGETRTLTIADQPVEISALKVREIPPVIRALKPIMGPISALFDEQLTAESIIEMSMRGENLITAVSIASRQPVEWVGDLMADDLVVLAMAIVEVNADFFVKRLMPSMLRQMGQADGSMSDSD